MATLRPTSPGDLDAATAAGWVVRVPQTITKRALRRIDHETLWLALHLDTDGADEFMKSLRRRCNELAEAANTLRERAAMLDRVPGPELDTAIARLAGHHRGIKRARIRWLKRNADMLGDLEDARDRLDAIATTAAIQHARYRAVVLKMDRQRSPKYSGRWRAVVLAWLRRALGDWTLRELAELIIASARDFTPAHRPPCSAFVDGADAAMLADRIKHLLAYHK